MIKKKTCIQKITIDDSYLEKEGYREDEGGKQNALLENGEGCG